MASRPVGEDRGGVAGPSTESEGNGYQGNGGSTAVHCCTVSIVGRRADGYAGRGAVTAPGAGWKGRAGSDHRGRRPLAGVVVVALVVGGLGLTGCSIVKAVKKVEHDVEGNKSTIDAFTNKIQSGESTTFEATYVTTGGSPATIVYAVEPPTGLAFTDIPTASGVSSADVIVNSSGEYSCTPPSTASSTWSCEKLGTASAAQENNIFSFYTPAHWIGFLRDFSLAAGLAGDKVSSSTMTVNGFAMQCVDFVAPGVAGTSTICSTAQDILGYVNVASSSTTFEIKSYSSSPPSTLFQLPAGATITTVPTTSPTGTT
jgi:hypothetical protein